jgi:1-acyl-sn-glycerol-3-phosphate acyltransferase
MKSTDEPSEQAQQRQSEQQPQSEGAGEELPPVSVWDVLATPLFVLAFAGTLFVFDGVERLAFRLGGKAGLERVVVWLNRCLKASLTLLGTRFTIEGGDPFSERRPCVIVSNHQAMYDIPLLACIFSQHRPRYVAKVELARWLPGVSYNLRAGESALIDRKNASQALREIVKLGKRMQQERFGVVLFPEGTRARRGALKPFRPSGFAALLRAAPDAVVVPVAIDGAWKLAARSMGPIPTGVSVQVRVGAPLDPSLFASPEAVLEESHRFVESTLAEWRTLK